MREIHLCPVEFQDRLTFVGGCNRYDEPMFKLGWAQYETFVAGGIWSVDEEYFKGYRRLLSGSGEPCWALYQWHDAIEYGSPESYYLQNYDESSGLQVLGEYPYSGRYEILFNLRWNEMVDDRLVLHSMPLNNLVFEIVVPLILMARGISYEKQKTAYEEMRNREEDEKLGLIERHLQENATPFGGNAVSFGRQGVRSTEIDRRMVELSRMWSQLAKSASQFKMGTQTR